MEGNHRNLFLQFVYLLNAIMITIPFGIVWYVSYASTLVSPFYRRGNWVVIFIFFVIYVLFNRFHNTFSIHISGKSDTIYGQSLCTALTNFIMYLLTFILTQTLPNPLPLLLSFVGEIILIFLFTLISYAVYLKICPPYRSIIVYGTKPRVQDLINDYDMGKRFKTEMILSVEECLANLSLIDNAEAVFLTDVHSHERNIIIKYCISHQKKAFVIPRIGDVIMSGARRAHMFNLPILEVESYAPSLIYLIAKRFFDIVLSLTALILLSPLFAAVSVVIKLTDGGPVFYKQTRLTIGGKKFTILKFRSMRIDAERDGKARLSQGENDPRITPIGHFLRRFRLDELPQIICILKGDMSICGPRPERPEIAAEYEKRLPEFRFRLQAKAGLTGYAQVYGKYNTSPYDKLLMDLMYIAHPGILQDANIILATVKILFQPESTEGFTDIQLRDTFERTGSSQSENDPK